MAPDAHWTSAADRLQDLFEDGAFELRFSLTGQAAVRVLAPRGPVAPRHAEPPEPFAPWSVSARCGDAAGWLLAERAPTDGERAAEVLQRAVERHTAVLLQRLAAQQAAMTTDLLEHLTHHLRTDIATLQAAAEGAVVGVFGPDELQRLPVELRRVGEEAQRRVSEAREVMTVLQPGGSWRAEPLIEVLRSELEGAGVAAPVAGVEGERPNTLIPGAGWAACARQLAGALAHDERLGGEAATVAVGACALGWTVTAGARASAARPVAWTQQAVGELVHAGHIVAAANGRASARSDGDRLVIELTLPAAPSG